MIKVCLCFFGLFKSQLCIKPRNMKPNKLTGLKSDNNFLSNEMLNTAYQFIRTNRDLTQRLNTETKQFLCSRFLVAYFIKKARLPYPYPLLYCTQIFRPSFIPMKIFSSLSQLLFLKIEENAPVFVGYAVVFGNLLSDNSISRVSTGYPSVALDHNTCNGMKRWTV